MSADLDQLAPEATIDGWIVQRSEGGWGFRFRTLGLYPVIIGNYAQRSDVERLCQKNGYHVLTDERND